MLRPTILLGLIAISGCGQTITSSTTNREDWVDRPHAEWPQFVLSHLAEFDVGGLAPASAFLIETQDGQIMAVTARHLLGPAGGLDSSIPADKLDQQSQGWYLRPRTVKDHAVEIAHAELAAYDMLILSIHQSQRELPSRPLKIRQQPLQPGDRVYLIGCPYSEEHCRQNVYTGRITAWRDPVFEFQFEPPVDLTGFSGAPVVDAEGHAVGVLCRAFAKNRDQQHSSGGADILAAALRTNPTPTESVQITPEAAKEFRKAVKDKGFPLTTKLRVDLIDGQRKLDLDPNASANDWQGQSHGVTIVIEKTKLAHFHGAVIDCSAAGNSFFVLVPGLYRRQIK